jgi:Ca-activated chloride channel family protein
MGGFCSILLAAIVLVGVIHGQQIKIITRTVPLYVTVTDPQKRLVPDLLQDDFEVYDNGKLQTLTNFDNRATPISAIVLLDTSASMTLVLDRVKEAAEQFLIRLLPADRGKVGAFNDKIEFHPEIGFSANRDELIRALKDLDFGYPTRLYDAVDQGIDHFERVEGRKVVVVLTDGEDYGSKTNSGAVLERAVREDVMVYSIGIPSEYFDGSRRVRTRPDRALKKLSEETGAGLFLLKKTDELGPTFTRIAQELRSQYVLGFTPEVLDGKTHKLEVRLKRTGLTPRARKTYVATMTDTAQK